jgi:hypothetical protein
MNTVFTFGFKLAELLNQNDSVGLGLLSLAIKDAGKNSQKMDYQDFKDVFQNQLKTRLRKANVANVDQVTDALLSYLNETQSLFTMSVR